MRIARSSFRTLAVESIGRRARNCHWFHHSQGRLDTTVRGYSGVAMLLPVKGNVTPVAAELWRRSRAGQGQPADRSVHVTPHCASTVRPPQAGGARSGRPTAPVFARGRRFTMGTAGPDQWPIASSLPIVKGQRTLEVPRVPRNCLRRNDWTCWKPTSDPGRKIAPRRGTGLHR
jgi:hypothetical protein